MNFEKLVEIVVLCIMGDEDRATACEGHLLCLSNVLRDRPRAPDLQLASDGETRERCGGGTISMMMSQRLAQNHDSKSTSRTQKSLGAFGLLWLRTLLLGLIIAVTLKGYRLGDGAFGIRGPERDRARGEGSAAPGGEQRGAGASG